MRDALPAATLITEGGGVMSLTRKDLAATTLTALMVACLVATTQGSSVPLIGSSHRWAAVAVLLLGMAGCALGSAAEVAKNRMLMGMFSVLGTATLAAGLWAVVSGRLLAVELVVAGNVLLWALSTTRHAWHYPHTPVSV